MSALAALLLPVVVVDGPAVTVFAEVGFCCLARVATALRNKGELIHMPGTSEYGRHTVAARTGMSRTNELVNYETRKRENLPESTSIGTTEAVWTS